MQTYMIFVALLLFDAAVSFAGQVSAPSPQDLSRIREELEQMLNENITPFWHPIVIDTEHGGYRLNHDIKGKWKGVSDKHLVTQARTVWFFSRLARSKYGAEEHLQAARHG